MTFGFPSLWLFYITLNSPEPSWKFRSLLFPVRLVDGAAILLRSYGTMITMLAREWFELFLMNSLLAFNFKYHS